MRESWTDERLDELNERVGRGFAGVDERLDKLESSFETLDVRLVQQFDAIHARFDSLQRSLFQGRVVLSAALLGILATQL